MLIFAIAKTKFGGRLKPKINMGGHLSEFVGFQVSYAICSGLKISWTFKML